MNPLQVVIPVLALVVPPLVLAAGEDIGLPGTAGSVTVIGAVVGGAVLILKATARFLSEERSAAIAHQAAMLSMNQTLVDTQTTYAKTMNESNLAVMRGIQACAQSMEQAMQQSKEMLLTAKLVSSTPTVTRMPA